MTDWRSPGNKQDCALGFRCTPLTPPEGATIIPITLIDKLRLERVGAGSDPSIRVLLCVPTHMLPITCLPILRSAIPPCR